MKKQLARRTSAQLTALRRAGKSQTDWARIGAMGDADIDFSDSPEITPEMFAKAIAQRGGQPVYRKTQLTLRVDRDVSIGLRDRAVDTKQGLMPSSEPIRKRMAKPPSSLSTTC
jgi:hypothetical protein